MTSEPSTAPLIKGQIPGRPPIHFDTETAKRLWSSRKIVAAGFLRKWPQDDAGLSNLSAREFPARLEVVSKGSPLGPEIERRRGGPE